MDASLTGRVDCLIVASDDELFGRVREVLDAWHLVHLRVTVDQAQAHVDAGHCGVVLLGRTPEVVAHIDALRARGAMPVVVGGEGQDLPADIECVSRPSALMAAIFRAQGRLMAHDGGAAARIGSFAQVIAQQFAMPDLVQVAVAETKTICDADGASLLLVDAQTGGLFFDTVEGGAANIGRISLSRGQGVAGQVALQGRARLVEDAQQCPDFDSSADRQSGFVTGSIVAAPLHLGGQVLGVLMAVRAHGRPPFQRLHLERLEQLTPYVAIAVHNVQMTMELRASQSQTQEANVDLEKKVKERTEQITRAKQEWEQTFDAIDSPIAVMDNYVIRRANLAYARKVGRSIRELPGLRCHQVFAGRETPCPQCPIAEGRKLEAEIEVADSKGRPSFFRFHGYSLNDESGAESVVVTYHDITASHVLAEKLNESERLAAVGQLASGAAHEINNPLGFVTSNLRSLRGLLDELRSPLTTFADVVMMAKDKRQEELLELLTGSEEPDIQNIADGLEMIDESLDGARRVGDIVKGLRELSRLEIGKKEPANVNASVTRAVRAELGESPPNLVLQLEASIMADIAPLQLDQALSHILRNAKQATAKKEKITVRTYQLDETVIIQVKDEGTGMPRENVRRVFEPFFTTRGVGKGIGLGLTAAYGIVKRAGGELEAHSEGPGKGSVFTVKLPKAEEQSLASVA